MSSSDESDIGSRASFSDGSTAEYDAGGELVRRTTPDGVVYETFDAQARPTGGHTDAAQFTINYPEAGNGSESGTGSASVEYTAAGDILRQRTADGTVLEAFDADGRPHEGSTSSGVHFDIEYRADGRTVHSFDDGTVVQYDQGGRVTRQETPDGTVYSRFDSQGRPTAGTAPDRDGGADSTAFTIDYQADGDSVIRYTDGTSATFDSAGRVVAQESADGTVYSDFDDRGRPLAGTTGDGRDFSIDYTADGGSVMRYDDGASVGVDSSGDVTRQQSPDGTAYTSFDSEGRPTAGEADGRAFTISYDQSGNSTARYSDGSSVLTDAAGTTLRLTTADGGAYTSFDADGRPLAGTTADGEPIEISYEANGNSTARYGGADGGTTVTSNADGDPVRMVTGDASYDAFDGEGRPTHGKTADGQSIEISYEANGNSTARYGGGADGGTTVTSNADGDPVRMVTGDASYDAFDGEGRPTHGKTADGQSIDISYEANGSSTARYGGADGGVTVTSNADGDPVRMVSADASYDAFDGEGRPTHGKTADGQSIDVAYEGNGNSTARYGGADGGVTVTSNADGDPVRMVSADATYDAFDGEGRPTHGKTADGQSIDISYEANGNSTARYGGADGGVTVTSNADGDPVRMVTGDATYDAFDGEGRPTHGKTADDQSIEISYEANGNSTARYGGGADGGTTVTSNADGDPVRMVSADATYDAFDGEGRPTHGKTADGQSIDISYESNGSSTARYSGASGGTTVTSNADGDPVRMVSADATYDAFDGEGRPTRGKTADGQSIDISYEANGNSTARYGGADGGVTVTSNADGDPVRMVSADATYDAFDGEGRPTHGKTADGQSIDIAYEGNGNSTARYSGASGGTTVTSNADGDPVRMVSADATYDAFDGEGRPTHGKTADGQSIDISYESNGNSTARYGGADGGVTVTSNADGDPVRMVTGDATYDAFDGEGRPTHGKTADGQSIDIAYEGNGNSTARYGGGADGGTTVTSNADGDPVRMVTGDASYDAFDSEGRPTHGKTADGQSIDIAYESNGNSTARYGGADGGVTVTSNADGDPVRMVSADATYDAFDGEGRPTHGKTADGQSIDIAYEGNGNSTARYGGADGGVTVTSNADGDPIRMVSADATYDAFDGEGRPTHGKTADGQSIDISYESNGSSTARYSGASGGTTVTSNADGDPVRMVSADASYDAFDSEGRPTHGKTADGQSIDIAYESNGNSTARYGGADGGVTVTSNADGDPVRMVSADATYDAFDGEGRPTHGKTADGQSIDIAYEGNGNSTARYGGADGGVTVTSNADGDPVRMVSADATYDAFDGEGRPTHGKTADGQSIDIAYEGNGNSTARYGGADGGVTVTSNADGDPIRMVSADATYDAFDGEGRPTHGVTKDNQSIDISYEGNGNSTARYGGADGGVTVTSNADGDPVRMVSADATYDAFDGEGRPTHGKTADGQSIDISYEANGNSTARYGGADGGVTVTSNADGDPIRMVSADATYDAFDGEGRPTHGVTKDNQSIDISYEANGNSTARYGGADGGVTVTSNADGDPIRMVSADATYDRFDGEGRPTHGVTKDNQSIDISYEANGNSTARYGGADGGVTVTSNADGDPIRMVSADATYDAFDGEGRPTHGVTKDNQSIDISYEANGNSTARYGGADGGVTVTSNADGDPIRMVSADATYDRFDGEGRPTHGKTADGQSIDISYQGENSVAHYAGPDGGITVTSNADGDPIRMVSGDTTYDRFDGEGRPIHGTTQDGQSVDISYQGDNSVARYDGPGGAVTVTSNGDGDPIRMQTPDATYDRFDGEGRPTHGVTKDNQTVDISYQGENSVAHYSDPDGDVTITSNADGDPIRMVTGDATYDRFDGEGRPIHGSMKDGQSVDISYQGENSVARYSGPDGTTTVTSNGAGDPVRMETADATYDRFDGEGRPIHGSMKDGQSVDISYQGENSVARYSGPDGTTTVTSNGAGDPVRMETADATYDRFDGEGRPIHGTTKDGQSVDISYQGENSVARYSGPDGTTTVTSNGAGDPVRMETADATYDRFDGEGRPIHGTTKDGQSVDISYQGENSVARYSGPDGTTTVTSNGAGDPVRMETADATYDRFDGEGRPIHGTTKDGQSVDISYQGENSTAHYAGPDGGVTVTSNGNGDPIRMQTADATYDRFDGEGRPTHGVTKDGDPVDISYQGDNSVARYASPDGDVTVTSNGDGDPVRMETPDATYDRFDGEGRPIHGVTKDGQSIDIAYQGENSIASYAGPDGTTTVTSNGDGDPVRMETPDATYDRFDGEGRPIHGTTEDGQSIDIAYQGENSIASYAGPDGTTTVTSNGDGDPVRMETPDATYDRFDGEGRPIHGTTEDGQSIDIAYQGENSVATYTGPGGTTTVTSNGDGDPIRMTTGDGATFTQFDERGRPTGGATSANEPITISYDDVAHTSTAVYGGDTTVLSNADGDPIEMRTPDATFNGFDAQGRPVAGMTKQNESISISYDDVAHTSTAVYGGDTTVLSNADGDPIEMRTPDATFNGFDAQGRPVAGMTKQNESISITYDDGAKTSTAVYGGDTTVLSNADGDPIEMRTPDATFNGFDAQGRPIAGMTKQNESISITYDDGAKTSTAVYGGDTTVLSNADGDPIEMRTPDATFNGFDAQGRPVAGMTKQNESISISYDDVAHTSTAVYGGDTTVLSNADGDPIEMRTPDATYNDFYEDDRPRSGTTKDGDSIAITYDDAAGTSTATYDGTTEVVSRGNVTLEMRTPDAIYREFYPDGRVKAGTTRKDNESILVTYDDAAGTTKTTYGGKTDVISRGDVVLEMRTPDAIYRTFDGQNRPTGGHTTDDNDTISITYDDAAKISTTTYGDGTRYVAQFDGTPVSLLSDGILFTEFDEKRRPEAGINQETSETVSITYDDEAKTSTTTFGNGGELIADQLGNPIKFTAADGTIFSEFYLDKRPKAGTADGVPFTITYDDVAKTSRIDYQGGTYVLLNEHDKPTYMQTGDGYKFDHFYDDGRPKSGTTPNGDKITFTYDDAKKTTTASINDGEQTIVYDENNDPLTMTTDEGWIFTNYDPELGEFTKGWDPDKKQWFDITYGPRGEVTWTYGKDEYIRFDEQGNPIYQVTHDSDGNVVEINYEVQIELLKTTAELTQTERDKIEDLLEDMKKSLSDGETYWVSPAGTTYATYRKAIEMASKNLLTVLDASIKKLNLTYQNYKDAEQQNAENFRPDR
ncbi:hypothetical protein [Catenuloplanes indicus]|uniref:YD repeat-containing protein n=1 Tax=Catenuloplanes indicus TaxID=137267 RepID=A0AAE3W7Q7_9ACTN|nr:hypothetical protein [Catenuloplanes indicus]MDQ0369985.1 YD repeat-containing protein [Catenuloplanes indicus]